MWETIASAPFDMEVELAVIERGEEAALIFPCRRTSGGWINAETGARIEVTPTHWRPWRPKTPRDLSRNSD